MKKKYMALLCLCLMTLSALVISSIEITYKAPTEIETGIYSIPLNTYWCVEFKPAGGEWQDLRCKLCGYILKAEEKPLDHILNHPTADLFDAVAVPAWGLKKAETE